MTTYRLLNAHADRSEWACALSKLPEHLQDAYYCAEYVRAYEDTAKSEARLFVYESGDDIFVYPFLQRTALSICGVALAHPVVDIETAYGYGGPIATSTSAHFLEAANSSFSAWCQSTGIVAEFVRFHPVLETQRFAASTVNLALNRTMCSIEIFPSTEPINHFGGKARNMVRRAQRAGLVVRRSAPSPADIESFKWMYNSSMKRVGALPEYYFKDDYYQRLMELGPERLFLLSAEYQGAPIAMSLFLVGHEGLHYHLSGRSDQVVSPGAVNLILKSAVEIAIEERLDWIHLGGGATTSEDDPLLLFKRSLGSREHKYFVGTRVHDTHAWHQAQEIWRSRSDRADSSRKLLGYHDEP